MRRRRRPGEADRQTVRGTGEGTDTDPPPPPASMHNTDITQIGFEREKSAVAVARPRRLTHSGGPRFRAPSSSAAAAAA